MGDIHDYFPVMPTDSEESLKRIDNFWNSLTKNLIIPDIDPRIYPIVFQVGFEKFVEEILALVLNTKHVNEHLRYRDKLDILKKIGIIDQQLCVDLKSLYKVRNLYAHQIDIDEDKISELLDSIQSIRLSDSERQNLENPSKYLELATKILENISQIYGDEISKTVDFTD